MRTKLFFVLFTFSSAAFFIMPLVYLDAATLKLSPTSGAYKIGDTFSVTIFLNTQTTPIDGVDIRFLNYNPAVLEVMDDNLSMPGVQITAGNLMPVTPANTVDTATGKIAFSQSTAGGGAAFSNSSDEVLATVHFRVRGSGYASVAMDYAPGKTDDANVVSKGTEALTSVVNAAFTLGNPLPPVDDIVRPPLKPEMTYLFTRNLMLGSRGEDVRQLQKFLNRNNFIIAVSGFGSPGNETTYFGVLTKMALIKLQEAYTNDILAPVGLTRGSGYFGASTRKKLNVWTGTGPVPASGASQAYILQEQLRALQDQLNRLKGQ